MIKIELELKPESKDYKLALQSMQERVKASRVKHWENQNMKRQDKKL